MISFSARKISSSQTLLCFHHLQTYSVVFLLLVAFKSPSCGSYTYRHPSIATSSHHYMMPVGCNSFDPPLCLSLPYKQQGITEVQQAPVKQALMSIVRLLCLRFIFKTLIKHPTVFYFNDYSDIQQIWAFF